MQIMFTMLECNFVMQNVLLSCFYVSHVAFCRLQLVTVRNVFRDIDWSPFDVNVFASCSMDSRTYLWDVRLVLFACRL